MAVGRIKGITIELDVNGDKVTKGLDQIEKASGRVANQLKDINKVLKLNPTSTEALSQKQKALAQQVTETTKQLNAEKEALKQLQQGPQTEQTIQQQEKLKLQIEETTAKLRNAKEEYRSFGSVAVQQLSAVGEKMGALGQSMVNTGRTLTRHVTAPIAALGGIAVKELADFEQGMAEVGAISQASGEDVEQMGSYARELAATTKFTAGEVTEAYKYMALAGWDTTQMMGGLEGVLNLVSASGEDLGRVSDIVTDGLTMFNMTAEESGHFADVLAVAMSNSNTNIDQLGEALKYIGPVAGQMGYKFEEVTAALGNMADNGIKGSTAGTTLRNILTRLSDPTDEVAEAMEVLGVSLDDGEGNMYSFEEVMQQLRAGFGDLKIPMEELVEQQALLEEQYLSGEISGTAYTEAMQKLSERAYGAEGALKAQAASTIAGQRGMAGLMAMVGTADEDWNDLRTAIAGADGASQEMRETMENTLSGQFTILKSQLSELAMQFGEILMPYVKKFVEWLQQMTTKFQNLSPQTKKFITVIAALVAAIGPLMLIGGKLLMGISNLLMMPAKIIGGVSKVMTAITAINPVTLAIVAGIAAVIAIGVALYKNWDTVKEYAIKIWTAIKDFFVNTWTAIKDFFVNTWTAIKTFFTNTITAIKNAFVKTWTAIKTFVATIFGAIKTAIVSVWTAIYSWLYNKIMAIFNFYKSIFTKIRDALAAVWSAIKTGIVTVWSNIYNWLYNLISRIFNGYKKIFTGIRDFLANIWQGIKSTVSSTWNSIYSLITNKVSAIKNGILNTFSGIGGRVANAFSTVKNAIASPFQKAWDILSGIVQRIKNIFPISFGNIFSNFRLPHISVSAGEFPYGIGGKGRLPSFSVDWYKKAMDNGMILNNPTIFGMMNGKLLGAGEVGSETVVGTNSLLGMIQQATRQNTIDPAIIYEAVRQGASDATIKAYLSGRDVTNAVNKEITMAQSYNARFQGV